MRRRLVVAKAERIDTKQLELEFAAKLRELDALAGTLPDPDDSPSKRDRSKAKPTGRRRLSDLPLPEGRFRRYVRPTSTTMP